VKEIRGIFGKVRDFLLGKKRVDTVLFTYFRGRVGRGRIVEDESRWEIGFQRVVRRWCVIMKILVFLTNHGRNGGRDW